MPVTRRQVATATGDRLVDRRDSAVPPGYLPHAASDEATQENDEATQENTVTEAQNKVSAAESKFRKTAIRTISTVVMLLVFFGIIWAGATYLMLMVVGLQTLVFRELVNVRYARYQSDKVTINAQVPLFRTLQYWWFLVGMVFVYTDFLTVYSRGRSHMVYTSQWMHKTPWICFLLFSSALLISILTLRPKKETIRYQMGHLAWTVVSLVMVCGQMFYAPRMIYLGIYWFVLPASLVVLNDLAAYFFGRTLGRRFFTSQFLAISPNKTWEGFLGALIATMPTSYYLAGVAAQYNFLICPTTDLTLQLHPTYTCEPSWVFQLRDYDVPDLAVSLSGGIIPPVWTCRPIQLHILLVSLVASLIAPFGGFLASAIKRANGVKDFDSIIPGHGGFTDRFDCQMLMSLYVWMHYKSLILTYELPTDHVIRRFGLLGPSDQQMVLEQLQAMMGPGGAG
eukprot:m.91100 g.91100  ORF g.91100 m.91100 type:complete len:453 (-) comp9888_c0_seq2:72-1430(-)